MKKNKFIYLGLLSFILSIGFTSCYDSDNGFTSSGSELSEPNEKFDSKIYFISNLKDQALLTSDADANSVSTFLKDKEAFMGILDRADATYQAANMKNYGMLPAAKRPYFPIYALNKSYKGKHEGSMLLVRDRVDKYNTEKITDNCYFKYFELPLKGTNADLENPAIGFTANFGTLRISDQASLDAFLKGYFKTIGEKKINTFILGTVKSSLSQSFVDQVKSVGNMFEVTIAEGTESAEYSIFLLAHTQFWKLKDCKKENIAGNIDAYELSLMW